MGTPEFAVPTLEALVAARHQIVAVYSQPPRPAGRGQQDQPSRGPCGRQYAEKLYKRW
jgi:methionyl-tRNA formyltransferase